MLQLVIRTFQDVLFQPMLDTNIIPPLGLGLAKFICWTLHQPKIWSLAQWKVFGRSIANRVGVLGKHCGRAGGREGAGRAWVLTVRREGRESACSSLTYARDSKTPLVVAAATTWSALTHCYLESMQLPLQELCYRTAFAARTWTSWEWGKCWLPSKVSSGLPTLCYAAAIQGSQAPFIHWSKQLCLQRTHPSCLQSLTVFVTLFYTGRAEYSPLPKSGLPSNFI